MDGMFSGAPLGPRQAARRPAIAAVILVSLLFAVVALSPSGRSHAAASLDGEEQAFLTLINNYRAQNGKGALVTDDRLNAAADWFATDMANDNYFAFNHYDNENPPRSPGQRAAAFGFNAPVGENIAAGFATAQQVFDAWKNSPGHNSNMLGNYVVIGIGRACNPGAYYGCYWVTDFAQYIPPGGSTPVPTPPPTPVPTPVPTPPPTPVPTPEPTPIPTFAGRHWGDMDCDGHIGPVDSIRVLRLDAGLWTSTPPLCPSMGETVNTGGAYHVWGDVNCSGQADPIDSVLLLIYDAGQDVVLNPGCPDFAEPV
jgi:uncharacterized protein YkwD